MHLQCHADLLELAVPFHLAPQTFHVDEKSRCPLKRSSSKRKQRLSSCEREYVPCLVSESCLALQKVFTCSICLRLGLVLAIQISDSSKPVRRYLTGLQPQHAAMVLSGVASSSMTGEELLQLVFGDVDRVGHKGS